MSESHRPLIVVTSIVPDRDHALHSTTTASWRAAGCEVISVNAASEIASIRAAFPDVKVVTAPATAERFAHKPVPYIHDLLKTLRSACAAYDVPLEQCTVGIINADIYFRNGPALADTLRREAQGALILGPRVDVDASASFTAYRPTGDETYSVGYDYFFMSGDLLEDFADSPFCMGMPFWDYWLPLAALLQGRPLKSLNAPVALHVTHDTRWDYSIYLFFHSLVAYVIELCRKTTKRDDSAEARQFDLLFDVLSHLYGGVFARGTDPAPGTSAPDPAGIAVLADFYDRFQQVAVHHIKTRATPIAVSESMSRGS
jgi:hypothetical protein